MSGHTPGPWVVDGPPSNQIVWSSAENRVCFLAHSNGLDDERDIATGNLIAAAPDLLEAALKQDEADRLSEEGDDVAAMLAYADALKLRRAAISKATNTPLPATPQQADRAAAVSSSSPTAAATNSEKG